MKKEYALTKNAVTFDNSAFRSALIPLTGSDAVFVRMAVPAGSWFAKPERKPVADVAASLLDEGTKTLSREVFRKTLEETGSRVSFWEDQRYMYLSIDATPQALSTALKLSYDALMHPLVSEESVRQVIDRMSEEYVHESEDTGTQADAALSRALFEPDSALYEVSPLEKRAALLTVTREEVRTFIDANYRGHVTLAAMGAIEPALFEKILKEATAGWNINSPEGELPVRLKPRPQSLAESYVSIPGKESVDVRLGGAVPLSARSDATPALRAATECLGGGFSDHLMQTIRDRDGLTYGTYARLRAREYGHEMYWYAAATFGNSLFKKGVEALKREVAVFLNEGITEKRLAEKREEIEGRYAVLLGEPQYAAFPLLTSMLTTGNPHDFDEYLSRLSELDAQTVKQVAEKYLNPYAFAAAGAIDGRGTLLSGTN